MHDYTPFKFNSDTFYFKFAWVFLSAHENESNLQ